MSSLTLITPTADRHLAFEFCERWMQRALENYPGDIQWVVADDGREPVTCHLGQQHLRATPAKSPADSFRGNLLRALEQVRHERILFIEDDDWYAAEYLTQMSAWFESGATLIGEADAVYYHLGSRRYHFCRNRRHASLCQTGIHASLVEPLQEILRTLRTVYVDHELWQRHRQREKSMLQSPTRLSLGIKGIPGKTGLGVGHRLPTRGPIDRDGTFLEQRIGKADARLYFELFEHRAA